MTWCRPWFWYIEERSVELGVREVTRIIAEKLNISIYGIKSK